MKGLPERPGLARRLPRARLHVIPGGDHDLGRHHPGRLAPLIQAHLSNAHHFEAAPIPPA